jgi:ABC-type lipoprotein release transport system permease subunit
VLSSLLFGVTPTDAPTYVAAAVALVAIALAATYLPARRAARTDPAALLRE